MVHHLVGFGDNTIRRGEKVCTTAKIKQYLLESKLVIQPFFTASALKM